MGFIEKFVVEMNEATDASEKIKKTIALNILSIVCGRTFVINTQSSQGFKSRRRGDLSLGGIHLNLMTMIIGKSQITRKSTVLVKWLKQAIEDIQGIRFGEEQSPDNLVMSNEFTPEGFLDDIEIRYNDSSEMSQGVWLSEEGSIHFGKARVRDYMSGVNENMCIMYDGRNYTTVKRGGSKEEGGKKRVNIINPCFNSCVVSTELLPRKHLGKDFFMQGLANRTLYVYTDPGDFRPTEFLKFTIPETKSLNKIYYWLKDIFNMRYYYKREKGFILLANPDAEKVFQKFEKKCYSEIVDDKIDSVYQEYRGASLTIVIKLAGLFCLSDYYSFFKKKDPKELFKNYVDETTESQIEKYHVDKREFIQRIKDIENPEEEEEGKDDELNNFFENEKEEKAIKKDNFLSQVEGNFLFIEKKHMIRAVKWIDICYKDYMKIADMSLVGMGKAREVYTGEKLSKLVYDVVADNQWINKTGIRGITKLSTKDLNEGLDLLLSAEKIKMEHRTDVKGQKKPKVCYSVI